MITKKNIEKLAQDRINELDNGTFLVDIIINPGNKIIVEIDNEKGATSINDCVSVSRNIEHNLDRDEQDFELEVTSPGLNKPFKVHQQYLKNIGKEVKVIYTEHGSEEGKLISVNDNRIELETSKKQKIEGKKKKEIITETLSIPFTNIKETKIIISFK